MHASEAHPNITAQLIWREYFYCMSVGNPKYNQMESNPICLRINWYKNDDQLEKWTMVSSTRLSIVESSILLSSLGTCLLAGDHDLLSAVRFTQASTLSHRGDCRFLARR